jgi:hypothetical protein
MFFSELPPNMLKAFRTSAGNRFVGHARLCNGSPDLPRAQQKGQAPGLPLARSDCRSYRSGFFGSFGGGAGLFAGLGGFAGWFAVFAGWLGGFAG